MYITGLWDRQEDTTETLMRFLAFSPDSSEPLLSLFSELDGAISHCDGGKNNFVYIPGKRTDRVVLVAHADTVWDSFYYTDPGFSVDPQYTRQLSDMKHDPSIDGEIITQKGWNGWGIGADDRAGCAMLWLFRNSGHSLLITDGEEYGQIGAHHLMDHYPEISEELNGHSYMIQLDRCGSSDYKTYKLAVSDDFCRYIEQNTGYKAAGKTAQTDIVALCSRICGVNLSIGYYNEHSHEEYLSCSHWMNTLRIVNRLLEKEQRQFLLQKD